jgi:hypothetical protein
VILLICSLGLGRCRQFILVIPAVPPAKLHFLFGLGLDTEVYKLQLCVKLFIFI